MKTLFTFLFFALAFTEVNGQTISKAKTNSGLPSCYKTDFIRHIKLSELPFTPDSTMNGITLPFEYFYYMKCTDSDEKFILITYTKYMTSNKIYSLIESHTLLYDLNGKLMNQAGHQILTK